MIEPSPASTPVKMPWSSPTITRVLPVTGSLIATIRWMSVPPRKLSNGVQYASEPSLENDAVSVTRTVELARNGAFGLRIRLTKGSKRGSARGVERVKADQSGGPGCLTVTGLVVLVERAAAVGPIGAEVEGVRVGDAARVDPDQGRRLAVLASPPR